MTEGRYESSSLENNKAVVRRFYDQVFNEGNLDLIEELFAPNYIVHFEAPETGEPQTDPEGQRNLEVAIVEYRNAFPDAHITIEEQIAEGDTVVTVYTFRGTFEGEFRGLRPTGVLETAQGVKIDRVASDKIYESQLRRRWW